MCVPQKERKMVAPYAQAIQTGNKCPHGLPPGACPICSGMGGGGRKDKDTARRPGEMTYNECMAAWIKIQAMQEAKLQAKIDKVEQALAQSLQNKIIANVEKAQQMLDSFLQKLDNMPAIIKTPIQVIVNNIIKPVLNLITKVATAINNIQTFFSNITQFIASVGEKLAMVFGEIKNFINAKISENIKKTIKTVLSLFSESTEENEESEEVKKLKAREFKKVLKGLFRIKSKAREEEKEDENKSA